MYNIYVNGKLILLTTKVCKEEGFKNYLLTSVKLGNVIKLLNNSSLKEIRLIGKSKDTLIEQFLKKMPNIYAAGGKVYNQQGAILFIYRNNKWDLPKGKIECNETIEQAALREVAEETGVKNLKIKKPLQTTYHIFKHKGKHNIKITYWFEMASSYNGKLQPQEKEGITNVKWLDKQQTQAALKQSYSNIKLLFP